MISRKIIKLTRRASFLVANLLGENPSNPVPKKFIDVELVTGLKKVPVYSMFSVPRLSCSRYSFLVAKHFEYIDKDQEFVNSWEIKNQPRFSSLDFSEKNLIPGDLVGFYCEDSNYNSGKDSLGQNINYTHIGLFLGRSISDNQPVFAHQFGFPTRVDDLEGMFRLKTKPIEILRYQKCK